MQGASAISFSCLVEKHISKLVVIIIIERYCILIASLDYKLIGAKANFFHGNSMNYYTILTDNVAKLRLENETVHKYKKSYH